MMHIMLVKRRARRVVVVIRGRINGISLRIIIITITTTVVVVVVRLLVGRRQAG